MAGRLDIYDAKRNERSVSPPDLNIKIKSNISWNSTFIRVSPLISNAKAIYNDT